MLAALTLAELQSAYVSAYKSASGADEQKSLMRLKDELKSKLQQEAA
jgi:hypothetical protein